MDHSLLVKVSCTCCAVCMFHSRVCCVTKGTLLNRLFGTNFDVMDESQRQQTTKGECFWLICKSIFLLNGGRRDLDVSRGGYECYGHGCRGNGWSRTG